MSNPLLYPDPPPPPWEVRFLSGADVAGVAGERLEPWVDAVARALRLHGRGQTVQPLKPYVRRNDVPGHVADRIIAMPAFIGGDDPVAGIKWVGSNHRNPVERGLPRASAVVVLNDPETNYPVAILDGTEISAMRTAAVTLLATRELAADRTGTLGCLGCGHIARRQLWFLLAGEDERRHVRLFDLRREAAEGLARDLRSTFGDADVEVHDDPRPVVEQSSVVVTATVAEEPYVPATWVRPGTLVNNVSIMDLEPDAFLKADKVVVDDWDQANREGKALHRLSEQGLFSFEDLHAELPDVLLGRRPGRERSDEVIVFNPMGMAIEDVACARAIHEAAVKAGIGTMLPLR